MLADVKHMAYRARLEARRYDVRGLPRGRGLRIARKIRRGQRADHP